MWKWDSDLGKLGDCVGHYRYRTSGCWMDCGNGLGQSFIPYEHGNNLHKGLKISWLTQELGFPEKTLHMELSIVVKIYYIYTNRQAKINCSHCVVIRSSSSVALQPGVGLGLLYNTPPSLSIPCSVSPFIPIFLRSVDTSSSHLIS